jgi:hypothetical protein
MEKRETGWGAAIACDDANPAVRVAKDIPA